MGILADEAGSGSQLGKYRIHSDDLDSIGARAIESALDCDLIVVDEMGPMELSSKRFVAAIERVIISDKNMLIVLQEWSQHPIAKKVKRSFKVITVTKENRNSLAEEIEKALE